MELFAAPGVIRYGFGNAGPKLIVDVDQELVRYYRSFVPKYVEINHQAYPAHISVVRKETVPNMELWGKYEGERIEFTYSNVVHRGTVYFWLNAFCTRLEEIRVELGLPVTSEYTRPPDSWLKVFHITIGNSKPQP